jgi:AmiR/NasT family two-component response regulator
MSRRETTTFSRRLIHQATGMVLAQSGTTAEDAYLIIQARAYADNRPMRDVAEDIIERRIRFSDLRATGKEAP